MQAVQPNVEQIVRQAARNYGISGDYAMSMADCESTYNPASINPTAVIVKGINYGHAQGLYQFIPSTWQRMSVQAGYAGADVFNAEANANVFAWAIANGHQGEWQCK